MPNPIIMVVKDTVITHGMNCHQDRPLRKEGFVRFVLRALRASPPDLLILLDTIPELSFLFLFPSMES